MTGHQYAAALREIADWYDAYPDEAFTVSLSVANVEESKDAAERLARALSPCQKIHSGDYFILTRDFAGVELRFIFYRATICERIVVGTEEIPERIEPAHTREKIEWRCAPIFQGAE